MISRLGMKLFTDPTPTMEPHLTHHNRKRSPTSATFRTVLHMRPSVCARYPAELFTKLSMNDTADSRNATELRDISQEASVPGNTDEQHEATEAARQSLLPYDGGLAAWRTLVSAFVFEALLWGALIPLPRLDAR